MEFPKKKKSAINTRESTITNAFVQAITPTIPPTQEEVKTILTYLELKNSDTCCYCGDKATTWDHFIPLVKNKEPTGYINEINNMVPACSSCNSSKGNREWREWLNMASKKSLKGRGFSEDYIDNLRKKLEIFEKKVNPINISELVKKEWQKYNALKSKVIEEMNNAQLIADEILKELEGRLNK